VTDAGVSDAGAPAGPDEDASDGTTEELEPAGSETE